MAKKIVKKPVRSQSKSQITPLGDRVLIRPFTEEALRQAQGRSSSGIIIPDSVKEEKSAQGKVMAVGPGKYKDGKLIPVGVKVGDIVAFSKYSYDEIEYQGEEFYLLKEENLLAIVK